MAYSINYPIVVDLNITHATAIIDDMQITKLLALLIHNSTQAIEKASPEEPLLKVSAQTVGKYLIVEIKDNGSGIEQAHFDSVFKPFFSTKPPSQGIGLGLTVAKQIVLNHQGRIEFESDPKEGTQFRVTLPVLPSH